MKRVTTRIAAHTPVFVKEILLFPFHLITAVSAWVWEKITETAQTLEDVDKEER